MQTSLTHRHSSAALSHSLSGSSLTLAGTLRQTSLTHRPSYAALSHSYAFLFGPRSLTLRLLMLDLEIPKS